MEKLNEVITALECCIVKEDAPCEGNCPYNGTPGCVGKLMDDALRILKLWDVIYKDIWDRTHEIRRLKRELKVALAERDAAREKLSWLEERPTPNDWGEYPPEFPREGM